MRLERNIEYRVGSLIYDANIYDGMNTHVDDLQFYRRFMPKQKEANILELCCGSGRLTIPLAKEGHTLHGVDNSTSMLDQAKKRAIEEGVDVQFTEADIRTLRLDEKYDLIFIPFNSIHHLYTNADFYQTLHNVKRHLKKDGIFIFDCFNPDIRYIVESEKEELTIADFTSSDGRKVTVKQTMEYESSTQVNRIKWHHYINGEFDSVQNLDMRMYFPQELDSYLKTEGFTIVEKFGDFNEGVFTDSSKKQIFKCRLNLPS